MIDTSTKEAVGLFRVTANTGNASERSVHMSGWTADGSGIIVANLHGKMFERIDVVRDDAADPDKITNLKFNLSAGIYLGKNFELLDAAVAFEGKNAFNRNLVGEVVGNYDDADTGDLTPSGVCKESGCAGPVNEGGARTNNLPICPITSSNNYGYITLASGGLFVAKLGKKNWPCETVLLRGACLCRQILTRREILY